jgi:hypothetical protein
MSDETGTEELESLLAEELYGPRASTVEAPEEAPEVVRDEPPQRDTPPDVTPPELPPEPATEPDQEDSETDSPEDEQDPYIAWATKKYGDDPTKWAKAARDMESHISRLTDEKHASDELAEQWYEQAQQVQQQPGLGMPLSAQEEQWVEASLGNPIEYARQAAFAGKVQLFNGVMERVAMENPSLAAQVGAQVQIELQQAVEAEQRQQQQQSQPQPLEATLAHSFNRLGIDLQRDGPKMSQKLGELGEYHPYVRAILNGNDSERDLAVQAVHDLTRASTFNSRTVERNKAIEQEQELRRDAMVVQTGGVQPPPAPRQTSPLEQGMEAEWRRSGAWPYEQE